MKSVHEIALFTSNVQEMIDFYRKLLEAEPVAKSEGMAIFMAGSTKVMIHKSYEPKPGELPSESHLAFSVANVDQACNELQSQGLKVEIAANDYYWGRSAYLRDPDGHLIELSQR
jgi:catechol 2,3-dioxygenase-like lactoylglutathione lyase family enzyme